jgi:tRNA threonylcarbamoyladenosine biosynthesis protein TsaE
MGAGKTTFIQCFAEALDVKGNISSPTFTGMNQYDFKLNEQDFNLYHLDLYQKPFMLDDAYELGDSASLWLIEWAENLDLEILKLWELNPAAKIYQIELSILDETRRQLQVNSYDDNSKESAKANLELNSPVH